MPELIAQSRLHVPADEVFAWHERPGALDRLIPPWQDTRILERTGGLLDDDRVVLQLKKGPFRFRWVVRHFDYRANRRFCDEQTQGPFAEWVHEHDFLPQEADGCVLRDRVRYRLPTGLVGDFVLDHFVRNELRRVFLHRHRTVREDITRHRRFADRGPLRIVVTGASGLVGRALCAYLSGAGHTVLRMVRRAPRLDQPEIGWSPAAGSIDRTALRDIDAVVHLAGENIAAGRWTDQRKQAIRDSRVRSTELLARTLASLDRKPRVFIGASAVGYYGQRGDVPIDESGTPGEGFLADVCQQWEAAARSARDADIRVVNLRLGMVLAAGGGALAKMLTPFRMGMGGPIGSGDQPMSWIALEDLVGCIEHALFDHTLEGPVNATSPQPVSNRTFARTLGQVLRRPSVARVPAPAVRLLFGEMGTELLLEGVRAIPARLQAAGFEFLYPDLATALRRELGLLDPELERTAGTEINFA